MLSSAKLIQGSEEASAAVDHKIRSFKRRLPAIKGSKGDIELIKKCGVCSRQRNRHGH